MCFRGISLIFQRTHNDLRKPASLLFLIERMEWLQNVRIRTLTTELWIRKQNRGIHFIISPMCFVLLSTFSTSLLINGRMFPAEDEFYSANILYAFFSQRFLKYRNSEQADIKWCYNMNRCYRIGLFRPTLIKDKGMACLIALLSNVCVETHVDLTAIKCSKGR